VCFVPIPIHKTKKYQRGFNQSKMIAQWLSKTIPGSSVAQLLTKPIFTTSQVSTTSKNERVRNIIGSMKSSGVLDSKKIYIIVDDVLTTGATVVEAMRALNANGATNVAAIALAHGYTTK
jgi:competence protein ComFC